jgi:elongation factor G
LRRDKLVVTAGDADVEVDLKADGDPLVQVFKTIADPYVGQISLFRVLSGTIKSEQSLHNKRSNGDEKFSKIAVMVGKESELIESLAMGDIGAVAKLNDTSTGDTLTVKNQPIVAPTIFKPTPVLATAIHAKTQADTDKLANALRRIQQEDPVLVVERNAETHQTLLRGLGETHLTITLQRLSRKFGVEVETEPVRVPYRETISRRAKAEGKYKKQSGGHGQFGVCMLKLEPTQRGEGFEFVDEIKGGSIPRQFIPAVEQGVMETMKDGGLLGFPVVDVRVRVYDGKYHSVDSSEMSFKMAGRLGFKAGMESAGPIILEPVSKIAVSVPSNYQGDVMGDLSSRRGQVQGTETTPGGRQVITALVPTSEIISYAMDLRSLTQGWGTFTTVHDHYQELPSHLTDKVVADAKDDD